MHHHYADITDRLGKPTWWDEYAVPRYCSFSPDEAAYIYAAEVVLLRIECQSCAVEFDVAMSAADYRPMHGQPRDENGLLPQYPSLAQLIEDDEIHFGDPPNFGCCLAGPTMNSVPVRVLEYWGRGDNTWGELVRRQDLERPIDCDWASSASTDTQR